MDSDASIICPEPKTALITPSASPPSRSFFPQPYRIPDQASPSKRPRLSSIPRQVQPHVSASSSSVNADPVIDFQKSREASTMRLLDVWSSLADRYSRPLDQDDIIDLTTGKVIKDRGVIRGSQNFAVGCFANAIDEDEDEGNDDEEDEEDVDELDSFANTEGPINLEVEVRNVPPVTEMDPADAEDLREFLEAETRRRAVCGSETEETEGSSVYESQNEDIYSETSRRGSVHIERTDASPLERGATPGLDEDDDTHEDHENDETSVPEYVESGSDDELGNWDMDEASMVYRMPKKEEEVNDSDSDIEFIDPPPKPNPPSPSLSPPLPPISKNVHKLFNRTTPRPNQPFIPRQLQTPPQSQASSHPSATPSDDYFAELPPDSSSPPRSSSPFSSQFDSSPIKQPPECITKPSSERRRTNPSHTTQAISSPPIPRLDLTQVSGRKRGRPAKSNQQKTVTSARSQVASSSVTTSLPKLKKPSGLPSKASASGSKITGVHGSPKQTEPRVEVVIEQPRFRTPLVSSSREMPRQTRDVRAVDKKKISTGAKGKGKEIHTENRESVDTFEGAEESDDPITLSSSPVNTPKGSSQSQRNRQPQASSSSASASKNRPKPSQSDSVLSPAKKPQYGEVVSVPPKPTRKRKRIVSTADTDTATLRVETPQDVGGPNQTREPDTSTTPLTDYESPPPECPEVERKQKSKRRSTPKLRSRPSDRDSSPGDASQEEFEEAQRHFSRAPSYFNHPPPMPHDAPYHSYPQPPYTPHHPHRPQPHLYAPIPDPRAQFIISQAMHQLSALVSGGPWTTPVLPPAPHGSTPYTPSHHRHYRDMAGSMYSTPTHHPHSYPYSYDPNMSMATLPPDSPPVHSSPAVASSSSGGHERPKSLVRRSQSRGRRVSFRIEEGVVEDRLEFEDVPGKRSGRFVDRSRIQEASGSRNEKQSGRKGKGKGKGKERPEIEAVADSEPESNSELEDVAVSRGRSSTRAQTPGPPAREEQKVKQSIVPRRARSRSTTGRVKS